MCKEPARRTQGKGAEVKGLVKGSLRHIKEEKSEKRIHCKAAEVKDLEKGSPMYIKE